MISRFLRWARWRWRWLVHRHPSRALALVAREGVTAMAESMKYVRDRYGDRPGLFDPGWYERGRHR